MSGGHFDNRQYQLKMMEEGLAEALQNFDDTFDWNGDLTDEQRSRITQDVLRAQRLLAEAYVRIQRLDWYISGDDSLDTYFERLAEELAELEEHPEAP